MLNKSLIAGSLIIITLLVSGCQPTSTTPGKVENTEVAAAEETLRPTPTATNPPTPTPIPEVRIQQADQILFEGKFEDARDEYTRAAWGSSDSEIQASALLGIGRTYFEEGEYERAVETFKSLINEHPSNKSLAVAHYFLAESLKQLSDFKGADQAYASSLALQPGILDDFLQEKRADVLESMSDYSSAIEAYQAAIAASSYDRSDLNLEIGKIYANQGDYASAIKTYLEAYETSSNDFVKAQANLLAGQAYLALGFPEQAYARFQDSINNFPRSYDSYTGLVTLVNAGQPVNELQRGLVDYYAGQYGYAAEAFARFIAANPEHDGVAHYYRGYALRALEDISGALTEWQALISGHLDDERFISAWEEIAYTQWAYLEDYDLAAATLKNFALSYPTNPETPEMLFTAARILEIGGRLTKAAEIWGQLIDQYPSSETSWRGLFLAGITHYRLEMYDQALTVFQRALVLAVTPYDQSAAALWVGKTRSAMGQLSEASQSYQQAMAFDPTGYYSIRAAELLDGKPPLELSKDYDFGVDLSREQIAAERWMISTFNLPTDTNFSALGELANHPLMTRGKALWAIGEYQSARGLFESLREEISDDPLASFRFMLYTHSLGAYRPAIFASRQILTLAGMDNLQTINAPRFFNLIRFGLYYRDLVSLEASDESFHPFILFSLIRQESFFEGFVRSSAGALGLMQIMPATGQELASRYSWPVDFDESDLLNPYVNIRLGVKYLASQRLYFDGQIYTTLAAYNGGPGNAHNWNSLAGGEPDLFLEIIRFDETRLYITNIVEFSHLYGTFYSR